MSSKCHLKISVSSDQVLTTQRLILEYAVMLNIQGYVAYNSGYISQLGINAKFCRLLFFFHAHIFLLMYSIFYFQDK